MNPLRNDPCPCGSGEKYKACCGRLTRPEHAAPGGGGPLERARRVELNRLAAQCLPDDAVGRLNYGNALGRLGRIEDARVSFTRALDALPAFPEAHQILGRALVRLGRND